MKNESKKIRTVILGLIISALVSFLVLSSGSIHNRILLCFERDAIRQAVQRYFTCEMNRDLKNLYDCLAISSVYRQSHSYEDFLKDVKFAPVKVTKYEIIEIYHLRDNEDHRAYPLVQKFVEAEVEVTLYFFDTGQISQVNQRFTFLKEGNRWLKG